MRLIDADALIEALGLDQHNNGEGMTSTEEWIAEAIMAAPTIEAEPVRLGRWETICRRVGLQARVFDVCSVCGWYRPEDTITNYCPNCGARMEEVI